MKISIFGLGYVGAVSLACLTRDGHEVIGVDIDATKLELIMAGKTPVVEEGMVDLMALAVASGRVTVTTDAQQAVLDSEVSLVCVGTPSASNGSQDQGAILRLAAEMGCAIAGKHEPHIVVFRSTLVPGTVEDVLRPIIEEKSGKRDGEGFFLCFQPEFLREGSSIRDYDKPPFTIVGANHAYPVKRLRALFGNLPCRFIETSVRSAEMMKYCCNNFHALKITFANETARLCEALGVDAFEVMDLVCQDTQLNISTAYLKPGYAFGGSCLPKDLRATTYLAKIHDVDIPMLGGIMQSNRNHLELALRKLLSLGKRKIGFVGLSFKTGTDDLRESPLVTLAEQLIGKGMQLAIYDPEVHLASLLGANRSFIQTHLPHIGQMMRPELEEVIRESEVLVIGLAGQAVADTLARSCSSGQVLLDLVRLPNRPAIAARVLGLCW
ncbi:MAG: UDP-glucose/GDP-mannose dehydrogenase family protein [Candidatus Accumulibacter sp.]|uniref:UDP-glucose 6-dehydrogenase n=1 Tax=Candidatus Accumulibacter cognatus TaxID=2954383 RepID=A0A080MKM7_9PROT|nr:MULTISPECIES: nucleotide sugar dehydrogenase [Candidatus Accumulibacter]KFB77989.1 MAG: GDP-mannose 6-dehydrogenase [Candidatus Accumulibacter cognatus]MBN8517499.1 UDP-glucose/GDP-mannose dehydrogenase family protein [Accumulibacter sp.]MBO3711632.1 UDP-glucose/GDP-mannose dehydrogenase family protein [Accumulibacter sp.]QLH50326.1 MAG: UDP-glucose/GDP-mannose dehydrogenase family protein [Candidatus Accumulibacter cognatus]